MNSAVYTFALMLYDIRTIKEGDMADDLKTTVFEALNNAKENGSLDELIGLGSNLLIAEDLVMYDADLEEHDPVTLIPIIDEWRTANGV
jgi:hypothetical protein